MPLRRHPLAADAALAAVITAFVQQDTWTNGWVQGSKPALAAAGFLMTVPLVWRRRYPFAVAVVVFGTLALQDIIAGSNAHTPDSQLFAWIIAAFSVAAHADQTRAVAGGVLAVGSAIGWIGFDDALLPVAVIGGAWVAGRLVNRGQLRALALERRAVALDRERDVQATAAVAEERARIARELHDVIAHSISVMGVQAGAVRRLLAPDQREQRHALLSVEATGRQALAEMRRLLGILRSSDDALDNSPPPSMAGVEELVDHVREAGLPVELRVEGDPVPLAPGVDVSAYRILQEALTNALKHAGPANATVVVRYLERELQLEITDNGRGPSHNDGAGHGLVGMRERAAIYGGRLTAGPGQDAGYAVRAELPLEANGL
jgi:signal transduction histidine kinase